MAEEQRRLERGGSRAFGGETSYDEVVRHLLVRQEELRGRQAFRILRRPEEPSAPHPRSRRSSPSVAAQAVTASARDRDAELGFPVPRRRAAPSTGPTPPADAPAADEGAPAGDAVVDVSRSKPVLDLTGSEEPPVESRRDLERRLGALERRLAVTGAELESLREQAAALRARLGAVER